jgi:hypothetical protein
MAVTPDATILSTTNTNVRTPSTPSSVTRANVAANLDQLTNSKVSRLDRPLIPKGVWDASTNAVPSNGDATVLQGYFWDNGNFSSTSLLGPDGNVILPYAIIRAKVDNPGPLLTDKDKWSVTYSIS